MKSQQSKIKPPLPIAWTIAGSDPGGGAGIQADLKTMNAFGVHGCSVVTALTAQNTLGVQSVEPVSEAMFRAQLEALKEDLPAAAIKTGMLGNTKCCEIIADFLAAIPFSPVIVCDPVLRSTSGTPLLDPEALDILVCGIFPRATVVTPNLPEAEKIVGTFSSVEEAADRFLNLGVKSVLITGGHSEEDPCRDYWTNGIQSMWISSPRIESRATHGTGCVLSSAIASAAAIGKDLSEAIILSRTFLNQSLKSPANAGSGRGPMMIRPFENRDEDRPEVVGSGVNPAL